MNVAIVLLMHPLKSVNQQFLMNGLFWDTNLLVNVLVH
jgi:hypothetical protein